MPTIGRHVAKLSGYAPALPTPFDDNGDVDGEAFERLCDLQITCGATALVVCGTTGEASTLTSGEQSELIRIAVAVSRGRVPVIAGAGSNATDHAIASTKDAEAIGADAVLSVVPYYNKPTQAGLYAHFSEIAASTGLPVILYDVPSRTACGLADATIARLAELPRIIGLKDASGDVTRPARLRTLVGPDFRLLSGDDALGLAFLAQGGDGCISVTSNVAPACAGTCSGLAPGTGSESAAPRTPDRATDGRAVLRDKSRCAQIRTELLWVDVAQGSPATRGTERSIQAGNRCHPDRTMRHMSGGDDRKDRRSHPRRPPCYGGLSRHFIAVL